MIEILRCNICTQDVKENQLEDHICSQNHRKKLRILVKELNVKRDYNEDDHFVMSVVDNWQK